MVRASWREPTSLIPLTWGTYTDRYFAGLVLIIGGAVQLNGSNVWTIPFLLLGTAVHVIGWIILPARGWRRGIAALAATGAAVALLVGPRAMPILALTLFAWLLIRHRPLVSYITVLIPFGIGLTVSQLLTSYSGMPVALAICVPVLVASAWLARLIAASARPPSESQARIG